VNLILANKTLNSIYTSPSSDRVSRFQHELNSAGIVNTIRQSRGGNIGAACGQLSSRRNAKP
jgi:23S rRNA (adenine2503-C2)-methyltransferase